MSLFTQCNIIYDVLFLSYNIFSLYLYLWIRYFIRSLPLWIYPFIFVILISINIYKSMQSVLTPMKIAPPISNHLFQSMFSCFLKVKPIRQLWYFEAYKWIYSSSSRPLSVVKWKKCSQKGLVCVFYLGQHIYFKHIKIFNAAQVVQQNVYVFLVK